MPVSPPCPFSGGLSSREGAFLGYLLLWSTRSPGIHVRLYAIASKIFCVCVRSSPRSARAFCTVAIVPAFAHPTSFRINPWLATFQLILISRSWACSSSVRKSSRSSATSMRILPSGAYGLSTMLASTIAPWSIRLIQSFLNCLFSSQRSLSIIPKRVSSARKRQMVLWSGAGRPISKRRNSLKRRSR